jgi:hypothetical protein
MGFPATTSNFASLSVTLIETQRKAAINTPYQSCQYARTREEWLEMQPHRFVMLGINADSYDVVVWIASQFFGPLSSWWLNRKHHASIPDSFHYVVAEIRKTSLLPNIRDDGINAVLGLTQGSISYASYTRLLNDFL